MKELKIGKDEIPHGTQLVIEAGGGLHIAECDTAGRFYFNGGKHRHYINGVTRAWLPR